VCRECRQAILVGTGETAVIGRFAKSWPYLLAEDASKWKALRATRIDDRA
jgi:hypothetical protein